MKKLKQILTILICAGAVVGTFSACGESDCDYEGSEETDAVTETLAEESKTEAPTETATEEETEAATEAETTAEASDTASETADSQGVQIANEAVTGITFQAPEGLLYSMTEEFEPGDTLAPDAIPTSGNPVLLMDTLGNNVNYFAGTAEDDQTFRTATQQEVEDTLFAGAEAYYDSFEITEYQTMEIDGYAAIQVKVDAVFNGSAMTQTMVLINAVNENTSDGYAYTITYTDMTQSMDTAIADSIATISLGDVGALYAANGDLSS